MNIDQFNTLLNTKRHGATASIPNNVKGERKTVVSVVYAPGGQAYSYRGFIYEVAERLHLIEARDMHAIAARVVGALRTRESVTDFAGAGDTIRAILNVTYESAGVDAYGRALQSYTKGD
jgi:hypothetical protein